MIGHKIRTYEVIVTQGTIKPRGGIEAPFERTFTVRAKTAKSAVKSVRDTGISFDKILVKEIIKTNPVSDLYEAFHGNPPVKKVKVYYEAPPEELVMIGNLSEIKYKPTAPSKYAGTEFFHRSGDTGERILDSNLILATDKEGKNLYLVKKDKKVKRPYFCERGIIG